MAVYESVQLLRDAAAFNETTRIPTDSSFFTYIILEAGKKLGEALYDYDMLYQLICDFHEKYHFDSYAYMGTRNPFPVVEAVDGMIYVVDDEHDTLNVDDFTFMEDDEYPEFLADPLKFIWSKALPRKCKAMSKDGSFAAFEKLTKQSSN